jgi:5'-AMP-activated protein kinase catalytic alpha subunit
MWSSFSKFISDASSGAPLYTTCSSDNEDAVGGYLLGATLGVGNYGVVKEATKVTTGEKFAIKIISSAKTAEVKLRREIENQQRLHHKHVAEVIEVIRKNGDTYIVMELISGMDLFDFINDCVAKEIFVPEEKVRRIFRQIISGVEHCHANMVAHRDLKPENMFLDAEENIKIIDFGLSAIIKEGALLTDSCGSPNYAAPELLDGHCSYEGPDVDIWSCGVVLYALLCNCLPFQADCKAVLFRLIQHGRFTVPEHVSCDAKDLIVKMLTVDRKKRITLRGVMAHPWFNRDLAPDPCPSSKEPLQEKEAVSVSLKEISSQEKGGEGVSLKETMQNFLELAFTPRSPSPGHEEKYKKAMSLVFSPLCLHRDKDA